MEVMEWNYHACSDIITLVLTPSRSLQQKILSDLQKLGAEGKQESKIPVPHKMTNIFEKDEESIIPPKHLETFSMVKYVERCFADKYWYTCT